jgi:HAD superfamily hydrolase (TIGR01509 family)
MTLARELLLRHCRAMAIQTVLFDFDGIVVDTEWAIYQAWLRTFEAHDHPLPLELYTRCIGSDFDTWSPKTHLEDLTGNSFDWHDLDARRQKEIVSELEGSQAMAGLHEMLDKLDEKQIPAAVVSSSSHNWVDGWLERIELTQRFKTVVCRGDAPRIKPAPDLYLEAAKRLEIDPANCLVIEDSMNGVKSAKAAGMAVWAVPNRVTSCLDFRAADEVFNSLVDCARAI